MNLHQVSAPVFNDRIERKFQVGIKPDGVADLWRDLSKFLRPYGLNPVQEITSVGSVYFDNKDCDLLRYSLLGHLMIFRTRAYERYGRTPVPINEFWVEVKTAQGERRKKKRFPLGKEALFEFLGGDEAGLIVRRQNKLHTAVNLDLYRESQETLFTMGLKPILLVTYKRVAFQGPTERLSFDWDLRYFHVSERIYDEVSWKDLVDVPAGTSENVIMETKHLAGESPNWLGALQEKYPIRRREYLKPVEGMGFLFRGPLKQHKEAALLNPMIASYLANSRLG
jgi:hypothetical protein